MMKKRLYAFLGLLLCWCLALPVLAQTSASDKRQLRYLLTQSADNAEKTIHLVYLDAVPTTWNGEHVVKSHDYVGAARPDKALGIEQPASAYGSTGQGPKLVVVDNSVAHARPTTLVSLFRYFTTVQEIRGLDHLNTDSVTDMRTMFDSCLLVRELDLSAFNTSKVTYMNAMFRDCKALQRITWTEKFSTAKVVAVINMFRGCAALKTLDVSHFDTSNMYWMQSMFRYCTSLETLDVSKFNTSRARDISAMFDGCASLRYLDMSKFNTAHVTNLGLMFRGCAALQRLDLSDKFSTANVTNMVSMFKGCAALERLDVSHFNTARVKNMSAMFMDCASLTELNVSGFVTDSVTRMESMFRGCRLLTAIDVSKFNTGQAVNMGSMFAYCSGLKSLDVSRFNTAKVTNMTNMFTDCASLTTLDVSSFNTSNVTSMASMFQGCLALKSLDVSRFNTSRVTTMNKMFTACESLTTLDLSNFDTRNATNLGSMFAYCSGLKRLDLSAFNTEKVTDMTAMFGVCLSLTELNLTSFNTSNVTSMTAMFGDCESLTSLDLSHFNTAKVTTMAGMFHRCLQLRSLNLRGFDGSALSAAKFDNGVLDATKSTWNFVGKAYRLAYLDMTGTKNFSTECMKSIQATKPAFTLLYLPQGVAVDGRNTLKTSDGVAFETAEYFVSEQKTADDTLRASQGQAMMHELSIPYAFMAHKVTHDRTLAREAGRLYTWCMPYDSPMPAGVEAFTFDRVEQRGDAHVAHFVPATDGKLEAQKPYLLRVSVAGDMLSTSVEMGAPVRVKAYTPGQDMVEGDAARGWQFVGSFQWREPQQAAAENLHGLVSDKWKTYVGSTYERMQHMRAFLKSAAGIPPTTLATALTDGVTSISHIELRDSAGLDNSPIYDLHGRYLGTRREVLPRGTYIVGGQKTLVP